ncbi:hypothetical protein Ciccas_013759, partial [Cichlidogyrus casuarinus]
RLLGNEANIPKSDKVQGAAIVRASFIALFWAHVAAAAWTRFWPIQFALLMLAFAFLSRVSQRLGIIEGFCYLGSQVVVHLTNGSQNNGASLIGLIIPRPIKNIFNVLLYLDMKLIFLLDSCLDGVVSLLLIAFVLFTALMGTIFIVFQIHDESLHLVTLTSNLINGSVNSELYNFLPAQEEFNAAASSMAVSIYEHGNWYISSHIEKIFENNTENQKLFETQVLRLWRKIYFDFLNQVGQIYHVSFGDANIFKSI